MMTVLFLQFVVLVFVAVWLIDRLSSANNKLNRLREDLKALVAEPRQIIHLDLKSGVKVEGVEPTKLDVSPSDFKVNSERLREILVEGLATKSHPDYGIRAYCILDHAGLHKILQPGSIASVEKALTRLLINGDDKKTKRFLATLADSVR